METNSEWVSVSTLAKILGVSTQTIRNRVKAKKYETMVFQRGKMKGILIRKPNE